MKLDQMRRQGASIFVYLIFGLLIAIFVLTINPSSGQGGGCTPASHTVLTVDGSRVHKNDYQIAYGNPFNQVKGKDKIREQYAFEMLIRRELLAQAAADRGLRVTDDMVEAEIKKGYFYFGGIRLNLGANIFDYQRTQVCEGANPPAECVRKCMLSQGGMAFDSCGKGFVCAPDETTDDDNPMGTCDARCTQGGNQCGENETCTIDGRCALWSSAKFKNWHASRLNVSKKSYLSEQARNMQAALMQDVLINSVRVAREEARDAFVYQKTTVTYDTVSFSPAMYRAAMKLSDADIQRYLAANEQAVKDRYKADERTYKDVKPQLKLRRIVIAKAEEPPKPDAPKPDEPKKDDKKPADAKKDAPKKADDKTAVKQVGMPAAEAKQKLEAARTAVAANKKKFVDAVTELSTDEAEKANGGDLGWRTADNAQLGDKALSDAVKALKPGEMTTVIETATGVHLIMVEDKRPVGDAKDLSYEQVKLEIAEKLAREAWSKEKAKRDALEAHAEIVKSNKKLAEVYPRDPAAGGGMQLPEGVDIEELMRQQGIKMQPQGEEPPPPPPPVPPQGPSGMLDDVQVIDTPVGWKYEDPDGSSGGSSTGSGSAGSATGSAAGTGSGSAAPPPVTPPVTPPAPKVTIEPTKDVLPAFGDLAKPKSVTHGPVQRRATLPGVGKDLVPVLFDQLQPGALAPGVYETPDGGYVIVQLTAKGEPKLDEFDKDAHLLMFQMRTMRARSLIQEWLSTRCEALLKDEKISPAKEYLDDYDDKGNLKPATYRPCSEFRPQPMMAPEF